MRRLVKGDVSPGVTIARRAPEPVWSLWWAFLDAVARPEAAWSLSGVLGPAWEAVAKACRESWGLPGRPVVFSEGLSGFLGPAWAS